LKQVHYLVHDEEEVDEVEEEEAGYICEFFIADVLKEPEVYEEMLSKMNDDKFIFKKQYHAARKCMNEIAAKQKQEDDSLLDLL